MIYAGILAAGLGVRMHRQDLPKPFLPLGEKPILVHSLEQFLAHPEVGVVVVVAHEDWTLYARDLLEEVDAMGKEIRVIPGGVNKTESIYLLARYIDETYAAAEGDILVAHDAIRPFVTRRIIDDNLEAAAKYGAANTVIVLNDTPITSRDGDTVGEVLTHGSIYSEQTPQSYALRPLLDTLARAAASGVSLADELELPRLYTRAGREMRLVRGEYFNMKILNPYDLEVANALLRERKG